jgi:hypothetical protein
MNLKESEEYLAKLEERIKLNRQGSPSYTHVRVAMDRAKSQIKHLKERDENMNKMESNLQSGVSPLSSLTSSED